MFSGLVTSLRQPSSQPRLVYLRLLVNGGLQGLADALLQPILLPVAMVWLLGGSATDVAMLAVAAALPWAAGAVILPLVLTDREVVGAVTFGSGVARAGAAALLAFLGWRSIDLAPDTLATLLVLAFLVYQTASAVNTQAAHVLAALAQPDHQAALRGFHDRKPVVSAMAVLGGFVAWRALAPEGIPAVRTMGWLLLLAGIAAVAAVWFQLTVPGLWSGRRASARPRADLAARGILRQRAIRRFLLFRLVLGLSMLADPFLIVYGISEMDLAVRYVGGSMLAYALLLGVGQGLWASIATTRSSRRPLQVAAWLRLAAIPLALVLPGIAGSATYQDLFDSPTAASAAFVLVFALLGLARSAHDEAEQRYLTDIVPEAPRRHATIMATNVVLSVTATAPLLGAVLIAQFSSGVALTVAAAAAFAALIAGGLLVEGNPRIHYRDGDRTPARRRGVRVRRLSGTRRRRG